MSRPVAELCKLKGEIARVREKKCFRCAVPADVRLYIDGAADFIERAILLLEEKK